MVYGQWRGRAEAAILSDPRYAVRRLGKEKGLRGLMKVIVADNIRERGLELLKKAGFNTLLTTKENIGAEFADADALIVRRATRATPDLLDKAPKLRAGCRAR